ncbi:hypothetical protein C4573_00760 [Candidatus Woesearchaeota archaeon]|nr:MAG: hypothetical protein C4573_00760 [Candidatus Woesearchaeota archaeon]
MDKAYDGIFKQSWADLKKNPVLFLPSVLMFVISLVLVFLFFAFSGIVAYLQHMPIYFRENPLDLFITPKILVAFLAYLVMEFILMTYFSGMKYAMAKEVVETGKTGMASGFKQANKFFFKMLGVEVISVAIVFAPAILYAIVYYLSQNSGNIVGSFFKIIFILVFILYALYICFNLLFVYPVLFFERKKPLITIKKEFHYVRNHFMHTLLSWLIVISLFLIAYVAKLPFDRIADYSGSLVVILAALFGIYVLEVIFSQWEHLFVMRSYIEGKTKPL